MWDYVPRVAVDNFFEEGETRPRDFTRHDGAS